MTVNKPHIAALVPMRHHSQRVQGKNYRILAGKPLFHYIITTLLTCPEISQIVVDTDSPVIAGGLREHFPSVTILDRPEYLQADDISMNEILLYDTDIITADFYLQTHTTNPLLTQATISGALNTFIENYPAYDSLFSVTRLQTRLWDHQGHALNHDPTILLQTQDLPPVYEENSCIYIFTRNGLVSRRNRLGECPMMFEIAPNEAWDIDDELDLLVCEALLSNQSI